MSWERSLVKFVDEYGIQGTIATPDNLKTAPVKIHISKFAPEQIINDVDDSKRKGIVLVRDLLNYGAPERGDKITYFDKLVTVDFVDPRVESGTVIGYDLILRGES